MVTLTSRVLCAASSLLAVVPASAQSRPTSRPSYERAVAQWFDSATADADELAEAVRATLDGDRPAIRHLGARIRIVLAREQPPRDRVELILRDIALKFLERARASQMFFAGQYEALEPLQPYVGRIYLHLVVDTPDWFPLGFRTSAVAALRDLFVDGPGAEQVAALRRVATAKDLEKPDVRFALACAFAQWGDHELIEPRLVELTRSAGNRRTSDELFFSKQLAFLRYELREYASAATEWADFLRGSETLGESPLPLDYYNAACSMSLAGDVRGALRELEHCVALLRSDATDESHLIDRRLFDTDPELRAVRPTRRFQELVESAFPKGTR